MDHGILGFRLPLEDRGRRIHGIKLKHILRF